MIHTQKKNEKNECQRDGERKVKWKQKTQRRREAKMPTMSNRLNHLVGETTWPKNNEQKTKNRTHEISYKHAVSQRAETLALALALAHSARWWRRTTFSRKTICEIFRCFCCFRIHNIFVSWYFLFDYIPYLEFFDSPFKRWDVFLGRLGCGMPWTMRCELLHKQNQRHNGFSLFEQWFRITFIRSELEFSSLLFSARSSLGCMRMHKI